MKTCSVEGCNDKHHAKGYCRKHHTRWSRHGNPDIKLKGGKPRRYCNLV